MAARKHKALDQVEAVARAALEERTRKLSKPERATYERHLRDLKRSQGKRFPYYFDTVAADRAVAFFKLLHHSKGEWAGQDFLLSDWQVFIIGSLFGWREKDTHLRRFRVAYVEVPRKNGKSTLAAGLALQLAFWDIMPGTSEREWGAEVYCAATKKDQAKIIFGEAKMMLRQSPVVRHALGVQMFMTNISAVETNSKLEPLGKDSDTLDGLNVHGSIIDEVHRHKTSDLIDVLQSASGARRQPLRFEITTAGHDRLSVCWAHHDYTLKVLEGTLQDEAWFAYIACADEGDDWTDPKVWAKANPNLGVSVKEKYIAAECERAKRIPSEQNTFRRMHCNEWTQQEVRFIDMELWRAQAAPRKALPERAVCWGGLDLASVLDVTALVLVFPAADGKACDVMPFFFMPADEIERKEARDRVPYRQWAELGYLTLTPGNVTDYAFIRAKVNELALQYDITEIGYDRWNSSQIVVQLADDGANMVPFGQGYKDMNPAVRQLERLLMSRGVRHGGNPILTWMAGNVSVKVDPAGNVKLNRTKLTEKIDGMVALTMAIGRWQLSIEDTSVYDGREMRMA